MSKRNLLLLSAFFGSMLALSCANRRGNSSTPRGATSEAQAAESRIDYAFGPMNPTDANTVGAKLIPFRSVAPGGAATVLPGIEHRYKGDNVFKITYADGSQLWLVQER